MANRRRPPSIVRDSQTAAGTNLPLYGIDKDLAAKAAAKFDQGAQNNVQAFIEAITGKRMEGGFYESLKDGTLLCECVNAVQPGTIRKINASKMPFKQMENISNFLAAARKMGVAEHSLFPTVSLYENKDINKVIDGITAFGGVCQTACASNGWPILGKAKKGGKVKHHAISKHGGMTLLNAGSAGIMDRNAMDSTRNITFGAENAGKSTGGGVSRMNMGSAGIMERGGIDSTRNITFGAENAGAGAGGGVSRMNMGSAGVMERGGVDSTRNITFGAESSASGGRQRRRSLADSAEQMSAGGIGMAEATFDYAGTAADELTFKEGDKIIILEKTNADWWRGKIGGMEGLFPANHANMLA